MNGKEDLSIKPEDNDEYHDHILNLLKIKNNSSLNKYYYSQIPNIPKKTLLEADLSAENE